jgi:3-hydroxymyristoyl/3-hydroxydecanoyl-(acyl carrier protein) dehydratase
VNLWLTNRFIEMTNKLTLQFPANHPTAAGHFPGNPIIPGALLLAEVLRCIEQAEGVRYASCNVKNAKFLSPARPGDQIEIDHARTATGSIEFTCTVAGNKVLSGVIVANT